MSRKSIKTYQGYTATIGIECHVQLKTKTKLFASVDNDAREADPNTLISHICVGMPGALPVLNEAAVGLAVRAAFALNTVPQKYSKFDRKHYFYPDLPKGYQISQFDEPIILGGFVEIQVDGEKKKINITRAHLEEDAGKSTHPAGVDYSLVDLNRAGTPLLEIVSEPEIHTPAEARAYAKELYLAMKYAEVSDASLYHGNMRFDVNVSVSKTNKLGTRSETKNLNSFKSVEKAVEYEINRQIVALEDGESIVQETRGWDDTALKTFSQRTKEEAHDYRYFPDPDLPPIVLADAFIKNIKASLPPFPNELREIFLGLNLSAEVIEDLINMPDAAKLIAGLATSIGKHHARRITLWLLAESRSEENEQSMELSNISNEYYKKVSSMVEDNQLSTNAGQKVFYAMLSTQKQPEKIAKELNLVQVSDEDEIEKIVLDVIAQNESAANDVKNGEMKAIGFLVGQVMKFSKGKANPKLAQKILKKHLSS